MSLRRSLSRRPESPSRYDNLLDRDSIDRLQSENSQLKQALSSTQNQNRRLRAAYQHIYETAALCVKYEEGLPFSLQLFCNYTSLVF